MKEDDDRDGAILINRLPTIQVASDAAAFGFSASSPSTCTHGGWSEDRVILLTKLWQDGLGASQIARQLGGVTRNAVIGKVHRLGLSGRATPSKPARTVFKAPRPARPVSVTPTLPPIPDPVVVYAEPRPDGIVTCLMLGPHVCKWPIGDPRFEDFTFCGRRSGDGPYCLEHHQVAYQPAEKKKATANQLARALRRYVA